MRRAATKALPSQGYLRSRLDYDAATGALAWKAREGKGFWNTKWEGRQAGSLPKNAKHRSIDIEGVTLLEHRVIWKWMTGNEPPEQIDHVNLNSSDNRWANLREADPSTNQMNVRARAASGLKGAHWCASRREWRSSIKINGEQIRLGKFPTAQAAHEAYVRAAAEHFGAYARAA